MVTSDEARLEPPAERGPRAMSSWVYQERWRIRRHHTVRRANVSRRVFREAGHHDGSRILRPKAPNGVDALWALSTAYHGGGPDYAVWNYNVTSANAWSSSPAGGAQQIAVAPDSGTPWIVNQAGTVFVGGSGGWTVVTDVKSGPDGGFDGGNGVGWYGTAEAIGVGPTHQAWIINNQPWTSGSPDHKIFELSAFNAITDAAWVQAPGGGLKISVSANGTPWLINNAGTGFWGSWYGGSGAGGGPQVRTAGGTAGLGRAADAGSDAGRDAAR